MLALFAGLLLTASLLAACGTAAHTASKEADAQPRDAAEHLATTATTSHTATTPGSAAVAITSHTSRTATPTTPTTAKVSTTKPRLCALLTLERARSSLPIVGLERHLSDGLECAYNTPEPHEAEASVSLIGGNEATKTKWEELVALSKKTALYESVAGLGEHALCSGEHIKNAPNFPTDIIQVAFLSGSSSFVILVESSTVPDCGPVVKLAREIEAALPSAPTYTSSRPRASPASAITAQNGPCYLPPASAATVTGVPMFIEAQQDEQELSSCAYASESKSEHVLLNLSTGSALINQGENGDACAQSQVGAIRKIPNGCLIFGSSDPGDPDGEILSVSINGKPAVTLQYQGPNGQSIDPVTGRLERAALVVGEHLAAGG